MLDQLPHSDEQHRAVSPVIGVILMVAITVILAAVIGAFVLEIGDQQETAPSTSFDTEQQLEFYYNDNKGNLTVVEISHAGGDVLSVRQGYVSVEGNQSVYGMRPESTPNQAGTDEPRYYPGNHPIPDVVATAGTNEQVNFESGQKWRVLYFSNPSGSATTHSGDTDGLSHEAWVNEHEKDPSCIGTIIGSINGHPTINGWFAASNCKYNDASGKPTYQSFDILESGDTVNVGWKASSGGKTQTLFKYEVQ
jgi:flagellin-like protein